MGFAYYADGAIRDKDELEPGIALGTDTSCADTKTCQAPQYFLNGKYLGGTYDNGIESGGGAPVGGDDFGLDEYEPRFARGRDDWIDEGSFSVKLKLTDTTYTKDLFYFCHIHGGMSGRIKVYDAQGNAVNQEGNTPALPYALEVPSAFDRSCGAYGIGTYNTSSSKCPHTDYVCSSTEYTAPSIEHFGSCLEAVDCKMHVEMQTLTDPTSPATTFMRQMIPHHENAVNMAKLLLKQEGAYGLACGDEEEDIDCDMVTAAWEMINGQNAQITLMRNWLTAKSKPRYAECSSSPAPAGAGATVDAVVAKAPPAPVVGSGPCMATCTGTKGAADYRCSFTAIYDPFASSTGYLTFEECGTVSSPTIRMDMGVVYEFKQSSETNWCVGVGCIFCCATPLRIAHATNLLLPHTRGCKCLDVGRHT